MSNLKISATFLIVGGGVAGVSCAEALVHHSTGEKIILLSESPLIKAVTNLIPVARWLHKFDIEERDAASAGVGFEIIQDGLKHIDTASSEVQTESGRTISYNHLCICTGARPKQIDIGNPYVLTIRDTESVVELERRVRNSKKIVIVGNGGIASEIAYEAKGVQIDWIVRDEHISSTFVEELTAAFLSSALLKKSNLPSPDEKDAVKRMRFYEDGVSNSAPRGAALGPDWHRSVRIAGKSQATDMEAVRIHHKCTVESIQINDKEEEYPVTVKLSDGDQVQCDFVVSAIGVSPEKNFTIDVPLKEGPDGGIFVDELMRTSVPNVYAAGDCCYAGWKHAEHWFQMRLWTQARQMGGMAAKSMAGHFKNEEVIQDFCFELFGHVTKLFGFDVVLLGNYNHQGYKANEFECLVNMIPGKYFIKYVLVGGRLQGAILVGDTQLAETAENLILDQLDLTPYGEDILDPNIDIEDYFD